MTRVKYNLVVTDDGNIVVLKPDILARQLEKLKPGFYVGIVELRNSQLERMKRYYFSMESSLARHMGCTKRELHEAIKLHPTIGKTIDPETGEITYESIAEIHDADDMLSRIYEFQQWAAQEYSYTFEPYNTEDV